MTLFALFAATIATPVAAGNDPARCGTGFGHTCADNECCSQYGYCGTTNDYCAVATCQAAFGRCGAVLTASKNARCGGNSGFTCTGSTFGNCPSTLLSSLELFADLPQVAAPAATAVAPEHIALADARPASELVIRQRCRRVFLPRVPRPTTSAVQRTGCCAMDRLSESVSAHLSQACQDAPNRLTRSAQAVLKTGTAGARRRTAVLGAIQHMANAQATTTRLLCQLV